jgi:hypothetical protein
MKKSVALVVLSLCMAAPSFAADVVGHSAKVVGKDSANALDVTARDSAKAATTAAKDTAKAGVKVVKFLF